MTALTRNRFAIAFVAGLTFAAAAALIAPMIGSRFIGWQSFPGDSGGTVEQQIFHTLRLPRVLLGLVVGATLAMSGAAMQGWLRNPLASEYTLGISSGAAFVALLAGETALAGVPGGVPVAGMIGGLTAIGLVWALARRRGGLAPGDTVLTGITVSLLFSALTIIALNKVATTRAVHVVRWLTGGLDTAGYDALRQCAPWCAVSMVILMAASRDLHQLAAGEDLAATRGVRVARAQLLTLLGASLGTAAAVSVCGPIGFVGLIVPHCVRLLTGPDARLALPISALAGAGFLALCDGTARFFSRPEELPVGVITATIGGPFFLWLLRSRR
ncbi:MAG: iron complex transport system permease [Planctomycetota bacterium]|nr:MAG: iron complex transport system permease [Planctomycetota bacterium]